jgi:hypothetical protein
VVEIIMADHNAHLTQITGAATPADPGLGIVGAPATSKWTGDVWAHCEDDTTQIVRAGQLIELTTTRIFLPQNLPIWPVMSDLLDLNYIGPMGVTTEPPVVLKTRDVNDRFRLLGYIIVTARVA